MGALWSAVRSAAAVALALLVPLAGGPAHAATAADVVAVDPGSGNRYATAPVTVPMVFPVAGRHGWSDTFLACRSGCDRMHMGQDVMAPKMTPLVAAFDGVVASVTRDASWGNAITVRSERGATAGWSVHYLHLNNDTPGTDDGRGTARYAVPAGLERGSRVLAGQLVGWVGDSGNAEETGPHLHVELRKDGVVWNPAPSMRSARRVLVPGASGPHPTGSLLRHPTGTLWLLQGENEAPSKHLVTPAVLAANGLSEAAALPMTSAESLGYRTGPPLAPRDGSVVRDPRGTTWLVTGRTRAKAPLPALAALGLRAPRLHRVAHADLAGLPVAASLPTTPLYPGALLRLSGRLALVGADGRLSPVSAWAATSHGWRTPDVLTPAPDRLPDLRARTGAPLPLRDGTLVVTGGPRVGVVSDGAFRRLHDARQVASYGYAGRPRLVVPAAQLTGLEAAELTAP